MNKHIIYLAAGSGSRFGSNKLLWSSGNYDYMKVDGVQYDAELVEGRSRFVIPVACFDRALQVQANTTAMSTPHEIDYTLRFDSNSLKEAEG